MFNVQTGHVGINVTDVALAVGFSDSDYFSRVFRQETKLTPSAYRRGQRTDAAS